LKCKFLFTHSQPQRAKKLFIEDDSIFSAPLCFAKLQKYDDIELCFINSIPPTPASREGIFHSKKTRIFALLKHEKYGNVPSEAGEEGKQECLDTADFSPLPFPVLGKIPPPGGRRSIPKILFRLKPFPTFNIASLELLN
jgi:hypothetical protein